MKNRFGFGIVFMCFLAVLCSRVTYAEQQISQFGITWTFDKDYAIGQFANGDYWVVGPVTIVDIEPASVEVDGRIINGSMINPSPRLDRRQGYDSAMYESFARKGDYDPSLNVARPGQQVLSEGNPLVVSPGSSLVSTVSTKQADGRTQLKTAAVLTVLSSPAAEGSFRPPYAGMDKIIRYNRDQLNYSLLANLKPTPGVPNVWTVERYFERPWLDHISGWLGRYHHPAENMPEYDREVCTQVGIGAIMLQLNFTDQQKEKLLIRYTQMGIDLYGVIQDGGKQNWIQDSGRKFPILFAGLVLDEPGMKKIGAVSDFTDPNYVHFEEDNMTFYVSQADVDITHSFKWNPDYRDTHRYPYEQKDIGLPEWTKDHVIDPEQANKWWGTAYRGVISHAWGGFILAVHIMGVKDLWNHAALFDYKDRYMAVESDSRETSKFVENMWDAYRADYGPVWTMSPVLNVTTKNGSVTIYPHKAEYTLGEKVTLNAVADAGYKFTGWEGDLAGDESPVMIIMHSNHSVIADFSVVTSVPDTEK